MPADMKETIAQAALTLLNDRPGRKLTVKDIVEQCHITRQTFYYHFADIPELFVWMIERKTRQTLYEALSKENAEDGLRCFFLTAIGARPFIRQCMDSHYRDELERLLRQQIQHYFSAIVERQDLYPNCTRTEVKTILRYHSHAILGLFRDWTDQDTQQLDQIVHTVYRLLVEGIPVHR